MSTPQPVFFSGSSYGSSYGNSYNSRRHGLFSGNMPAVPLTLPQMPRMPPTMPSMVRPSEMRMQLPLMPYSVWTSKPFTFKLGQDETPLTVHSGVIAQRSAPLDCLMNNDRMLESQQGFAVFKDVEETTFIQFLQFSYSGDYDSANTKDVNSSFATCPTSFAAIHRQGLELEEKKAAITRAILEVRALIMSGVLRGPELEAAQQDLRTKIDQWNALAQQQTEGAVNADVMQQEALSGNFEQNLKVMFDHFKLYLFADKWCVPHLKELTVAKAQQAVWHLSKFDMTADDIEEILKLARYIYVHTTDHGYFARYDCRDIDPMRNIITDHVVHHLVEMIQYTAFTDLVDQEREIGRDIMYKANQEPY